MKVNNPKSEEFFRVVTWNCRGGLDKKFEKLKKLNADAYVIQECQNPDNNIFMNYSVAGWDGYKKKGIGIFVKEKHEFQAIEVESKEGGFYTACHLENGLNILGIYAWHKNDSGKGIKDYSKDLLKDLEKNQKILNNNFIIAGDFNMDKSNWEEEIPSILSSKGLVSAYHKETGEPYCNETKKTHYDDIYIDPFIRWREVSHIDYIFVPRDRKIKFELGNRDEWIYRDRNYRNEKENSDQDRSDHLPLIVDIKL